MTITPRNVDDLIHGIEVKENAEKVPLAGDKNDEKSQNNEENLSLDAEKSQSKPEISENYEENDDNEEKNAKSNDKSAENAEITEKANASGEERTDEYGNPLPKPRTYTEEEVNEMMRKRFNRGAFKEQQGAAPQVEQQYSQQEVQNAQKAGFEYNPDSTDDWQVQLDKFIRHTISSVRHEEQAKVQQAQAKAIAAQEAQKQAEFEAKIFADIPNYPDFEKVMTNQPITDAMMYGIRNLNKPAAFLYAAAKRASDELARIAKIPDAYEQIAEMGKLQAKLSKPHKKSTNAPRAMERDRSDVSDKTPAKVSIDHLIASDAEKRVRR